MNKEKKTILIVGASSGLGRKIAARYAELGWKVGVCARREDALRQFADAYPGTVMFRTLDVTAPGSADILKDFIGELGGVDVLLYAAGCGWNNPGLDVAFDERTVQTNVVGFTRIINAAFEWFVANPSPDGSKRQLCAITSIAGTKGIGISATYSATKRYQNTYLECLAQLARTRRARLDITDIRPGFVDTALLDTSVRKYPMLMSVDYAAKRIVRAIDRRRKIAWIDWRWHIVVCLWRLIPRCVWTRIHLDF